MTDLLLCPFCGAAPIVNEIEPHSHKGGIAAFMPDHPGSFTVECGCGAGMIDETLERVTARWNLRSPPAQCVRPSSLPICCVTGRIAGDGFACGDCDPCSAAHAVPEAVKALLKERDEFAGKYEVAMMEFDEFKTSHVSSGQMTGDEAIKTGAQALADDVWHPPQKFESLPPYDQNKFKRQARLVLEATRRSPGDTATEVQGD